VHTKNTTPVALREVVARWRALAKDDDPIVRAAARELLADLSQGARSRPRDSQRRPTYWRQVIGEVIAAEPCYSRTDDGYKTGHGHVHGSKSGTCVSVNTSLGLWYCSSCRRGGDTVAWVMDTDECNYGQAWNILVDRFGAARANRD
jgi:hypothetical protein